MDNAAANIFGDPIAPLDVLRWYVDAGVDESIGDEPLDRYAQVQPQPQFPSQAPAQQASRPPTATPDSPAHSPSVEDILRGNEPAPSQAPRQTVASVGQSSSVRAACTAAAAAQSIDQLRAAAMEFDACPLKKTATSTVFADGNPKADVMVIGEAPGADEDRQGLPFVGANGRLLDRMLASIDLDRSENTYLTNIVFWRPPGNRSPTAAEIATCLPFAERHIELVQPKVLIILGGPAAKSLLAQRGGITRLHGTWFQFETPGLSHPIPTMPLYHPDNLLKSPGHKRATWRDLLAVRAKLTPDD